MVRGGSTSTTTPKYTLPKACVRGRKRLGHGREKLCGRKDDGYNILVNMRVCSMPPSKKENYLCDFSGVRKNIIEFNLKNAASGTYPRRA